jgi:mannan endo-1,4-beta-mannosidase
VKSVFKIIILVSYIIIFALFLGACSALFLTERQNYIKINGTHFELNGKSYYFEGANFWTAAYFGASGQIGDRERLTRELDELQSLGITNLRILGASEQSIKRGVVKPGFITGPGLYNEELLKGMDFLLSEMKKRDMHAVIFLTNTWEWSGGMGQYNVWADDSNSVDAVVPGMNYPEYMNYVATFYRSEKAKKIYYKYLYTLITRKNAYTGSYYYEDPAIMAWEIANEPRPGQGEEAEKWLDEYYRWINSTALYIHTLDPNHLVSTGSEGIVGSIDSAQVYVNANQSKYIDYLTFHLWPKDWSWFNINEADSTYPSTEINSVNYINEHIKLAGELGKPVVLEEFGLQRDNSIIPGTPTVFRDKFYNTILSLVYNSASSGSPVAGAAFWLWGGEGASKIGSYKWGFGSNNGMVDDDNSVYDADISTLNILKEYAGKFNSLIMKNFILN